MKLDGFERRTRALEARHHADVGSDEAAKMQLFMEKHSDEELRGYQAICKRTQDGVLPLLEEEKRFIDEMEAKYGPI